MLGVGAVLIPALVVWWLAVDGLITGLRPVSAWLAHLLTPVNAVTPDTDGSGWIVQTGIVVVAGKTIAGGELAIYAIPGVLLRQLTVTWPLFLAFMLAPPRPQRLLGRLFAGVLALAVLFVLSVSILAFFLFAALVNHVPSQPGYPPPPFYVAWPAYGEVTFLLARLGRYAACDVLPLFTPPVLWFALNPAARRAFFGRDQEAGRIPTEQVRQHIGL